MISLAVLILIIVISSIVVKTGAIALRLTGLDEESASFQALSAWTNTGFTTREAEHIDNHPARRRVVKTLIILGNAGVIGIIAALIRSFGESQAAYHTVIGFSVSAVGLYLLYRIAIARRVKRVIDRFIAGRLSALPNLEASEFQQILSLGGENAISYIEISEENPIAGLTLKQAALNSIKIIVLSVERESEHLPTPAASMVLQPGDRLVAYGNTESMKTIAQGEYLPPGYKKPEASREPGGNGPDGQS